MLIKKIVTLTLLLLISSLLISCAGKNISTVQNTDSYLTDLVATEGITEVTSVTNIVIVNEILTNVKWTESKSDDGTVYIYATGKYKDIEKAKKYACLTQFFFLNIFTKNNADWNKSNNNEETITILKEMIKTFFRLTDVNKVQFKFNADGNFQENKDDPYIFNSLVFLGYTINLTGIDKAINLPSIDEL